MSAVILTYHAVEAGPEPLCIEPALFREHAAAIAASGAECLTVHELGEALRLGKLPERAVAITFDDGCESVVTNAAPLLAEHGLRATVFCVAGYLGRTNDWPGQRASAHRLRLASGDALAELARAGHEIGSHGYEHAALNGVSKPLAAREIESSKEALETTVGRKITSFAWPYGATPSDEVALLVASAYQAACSTILARVDDDSQVLALPRIDAHYLRRPGLLRRVLEGSLDSYLGLRALGARIRRAMWKDYE
jgi:peptidoglycan/xylan/chitin deacetylase (PgdA/CDA1 family)